LANFADTSVTVSIPFSASPPKIRFSVHGQKISGEPAGIEGGKTAATLTDGRMTLSPFGAVAFSCGPEQ
jgi:hypothetical protein